MVHGTRRTAVLFVPDPSLLKLLLNQSFVHGWVFVFGCTGALPVESLGKRILWGAGIIS